VLLYRLFYILVVAEGGLSASGAFPQGFFFVAETDQIANLYLIHDMIDICAIEESFSYI